MGGQGKAVVREAGTLALRKTLGSLAMMESNDEDAAMNANGDEKGKGGEGDVDVDVRVGVEEFVKAMEKVPPSVSRTQRRKYEALREKFAGMPVGGRKAGGADVKPDEGEEDKAKDAEGVAA